MPSLLDSLARRKLVVVTGKGGVGKSAVASALGLLLARLGRRTLVLEIDPRENVHQLLGLPPSGGEIVAAPRGLLGGKLPSVAPADRSGSLWLQNMKPRQVLDQIIVDEVPIGMIARRVLKSPIYHQLSEGMPGLEELAVVRHARQLTEGSAGADASRFDCVVLDAPATGHGVSLLAAPGLVAEVIEAGPVGRIAAELAAFVADPERCGIVIVTLAEEMPVDEALELAALLDERLDRRPELLVVNGLYPRWEGEAGGNDSLSELWRRRRRVNEEELARLAERWPGPRRHLPLLPLDRGPELVAALAGRLSARLADDLVEAGSEEER